MMKAAFHVARTGRCGPVLVDVPRDIQEAEVDFSYPETVDLPGWRPPRKVHPLQIREAARADRAGREARALRRRRHDQRRRLRRAARSSRRRAASRDHDADGQGRLPRDAPAVLRLAGHARHEVVEPRHEHVRRARRDRRALRRPRHRQALGVRARRDGRPPRHRPGRDLQAARRRRPRRRPAEEGAGRARGRGREAPRRRRSGARGVAAQDRGVARRVPAPLRHAAATGSSRRS